MAIPSDSLAARLAEAAAHEAAGRLADAAAAVAGILAEAPHDAAALHLDGVVRHRMGDLAGAIAALERSLAREPGRAPAHRDLCELYRLAGRLDAALTQGRHAVALAPADPLAHYNLGLAHADRLELDAALACQDAAVALAPDLADAQFERAEILLVRGDLRAGWEAYEWRWRVRDAPALLRDPGGAPWSGEPLPEGTLLLVADQGFGDTIQFLRYIPAAAERCRRLVVACSPEMRPLIERQRGVAATVERWDALPAFDRHCALSSLPRAFGTTLATIPAPIPYLRADSELARRWRARLDGLAPARFRRLGLVWAGRPTHGNDHNRSLTLDRLAPLAGLPRTVLVSLQLGPAQAQVGFYLGPAPLLHLGPEIAGFPDTMAILDSLDAVVAVDTAVAHLAGAMGKRVHLLLPFAPDWRWLLDRADSPWYPTARLYRQTAPGDWSAPIAALARDLTCGRDSMRRLS